MATGCANVPMHCHVHAASVVAARPELVRHILGYLNAHEIARAEGTSRVFLEEGRAERLERNDVPLLYTWAKRTCTRYTYDQGLRWPYLVRIPMFRAAQYPTRAALMTRMHRLRTVPVANRTFGWSTFFKNMCHTRWGLHRLWPSSPALPELRHFIDSFAIVLNRTGVDWEYRGVPEALQPALRDALVEHVRLLSYGSLYVVCYFAGYLRA